METINGLSIDGGGIRGLIVAVQLRELEKQLGTPIKDNFQYMGLNSTSGILGVLLCLGYTADDLIQFYKTHGPIIFEKKPLRWGFFKPRYDKKYFDKVLNELVGDKKLSDLTNNIIVSATNYTDRYNEKLVFLFKSEKARVDPSKDFYLKDVIKATTAAPTYFKPEIITSVNGETKLVLADGGFVVNNPSFMTFVEMMKSYPKEVKNILSFSTGKKIPSLEKQEKNLQELIEEGAAKNVDDYIEIQLDANQYIADYNTSFMKDINLLNYYIRLKSYIYYSDGSIDNVKLNNIKLMIEDGEKSANLNRLLMKRFVEKM